MNGRAFDPGFQGEGTARSEIEGSVIGESCDVVSAAYGALEIGEPSLLSDVVGRNRGRRVLRESCDHLSEKREERAAGRGGLARAFRGEMVGGQQNE